LDEKVKGLLAEKGSAVVPRERGSRKDDFSWERERAL